MASTDHSLMVAKKKPPLAKQMLQKKSILTVLQLCLATVSAGVLKANSTISHYPRSGLAVCLPSHAGNTICVVTLCFIIPQRDLCTVYTFFKICSSHLQLRILTQVTACDVTHAAHTGVNNTQTPVQCVEVSM